MTTHCYGPFDLDASPEDLERTRGRLNLAWALQHPETFDPSRVAAAARRLELVDPPVFVAGEPSPRPLAATHAFPRSDRHADR